MKITLRDWSRACAAGAVLAIPVFGLLGVLSETGQSFALREWAWCVLVAGVLLGLAAMILEMQDNIEKTLKPPAAPPQGALYLEDDSEEMTRAAMKRAADAYIRKLEPSFFQKRGAL